MICVRVLKRVTWGEFGQNPPLCDCRGNSLESKAWCPVTQFKASPWCSNFHARFQPRRSAAGKEALRALTPTCVFLSLKTFNKVSWFNPALQAQCVPVGVLRGSSRLAELQGPSSPSWAGRICLAVAASAAGPAVLAVVHRAPTRSEGVCVPLNSAELAARRGFLCRTGAVALQDFAVHGPLIP
ncbi:methylmalonyl-CoA epimerase [Platysternon megacephalum]|uniref:Methylmalonyl-CoA epimerase n=1 Tax=Platysternon megacephalum TaxID=55544 RepID=A0A4D9DME9_9SAUR|nr:methylmalonyl-CoA epimerase [Platysternon megacephalum]